MDLKLSQCFTGTDALSIASNQWHPQVKVRCPGEREQTQVRAVYA